MNKQAWLETADELRAWLDTVPEELIDLEDYAVTKELAESFQRRIGQLHTLVGKIKEQISEKLDTKFDLTAREWKWDDRERVWLCEVVDNDAPNTDPDWTLLVLPTGDGCWKVTFEHADFDVRVDELLFKHPQDAINAAHKGLQFITEKCVREDEQTELGYAFEDGVRHYYNEMKEKP